MMAYEFRAKALLGVSALAAATALFPNLASAQESKHADLSLHSPAPQAPANGSDEGLPHSDAIVVTGSRIAGVDPVGSAVIAIGRDDIETSSAVTTADLLREVPQISNFGITASSRGQSDGASNLTFINSVNIRGIAPYATLTLINGHRVVGQGTTGFSVDPDLIPPIALERIEVIADGASAIYGSDAVTGVANLIMRRNYDGIGLSGQYSFADDYDEYQANAIVGKNLGWGRFMAAYSYTKKSSLNGLDRDYYSSDLRSQGGDDYRINLCNPGNIEVSGKSYAIPAGGVTPGNANSLMPGTSNLCDPFKAQDLIPEVSRHSAVATFDVDATDWLSFYGDGFYVWRDYDVRLPDEFSNLTVPNTNAFFVAPPGTNPTSEAVNYSFGNDYANTRFGHTETWSGTVGAKVRLPGDFEFKGDVTIGSNLDSNNRRTVIDSAALRTALASSDPQTAFNPFGGPNSPAVLASILTGVNRTRGNTDFTGYNADLSGPLFKLPGGDVRAVVGYERQEIDIALHPFRGTIANPIPTDSPPQSRSVDSFYGEVFVPVFGYDNAVPGIQKLELDLALRRDNYSDVGGTTNPKIGVNYSPIEGVTLHGSYGTSFRAPGLAQIFGNVDGLYIRTYYDPTCDCVIQGVVRSGGNRDIEPETARSYSLGIDFDPREFGGFHASINYFDLDYKGQVQRYTTDYTILSSEADFAGTGVITRNPSPALIAQQVAEVHYTGIVPNPVVLFVDGRSLNLGRTIAKGIDFEFGYQTQTAAAGTFALSVDGTWFLKYATAISPAAPLRERANEIYNPLTFRGRARIDWTNERGLRAAATVNFVNSYTNPNVVPEETIDARATVDLFVGVDLNEMLGQAFSNELRLGLNVRNLFDADPSFVNIAPGESSPGGYDATVSDALGRVVSVSLNLAF